MPRKNPAFVITLINRSRHPLPVRLIHRSINQALEILKAPLANLRFLFVGSRQMRRYHHRFLGVDEVTDVMAFPEGAFLKRDRRQIVGDIAVSPAMARDNARIYRESFRRELCRYAVHGILHLAGFRDKKASERKRMFQLQEKILNVIFEKE